MLDGRFDDVSMVIDVGQILAPRHQNVASCFIFSAECHSVECRGAVIYIYTKDPIM
jgi:hypothetical protein